MDGGGGEARGPLRPTAPTEPRREEPGAGFPWRWAGARPLSVGWVGRARTGRGFTVATASHPCSGLLLVWPSEPHPEGDVTPPPAASDPQ